MLQQTQTDRVIPKYEAFIARFPTAKALATSPLADVLKLWKGLGYNRRARYLQLAARSIVEEHANKVPKSYEDLIKLPGIGPATAGDVLAFAFNIPASVLETNIETALIHDFFPPTTTKIPKKSLLELVTLTMDAKNPRTWYYALMDYGAHIKKTVGNASRRAASYKKQGAFAGSSRQTRARLLFLIHQHAGISTTALMRHYKKSFDGSPIDTQTLSTLLKALNRDGLIESKKSAWYIPE